MLNTTRRKRAVLDGRHPLGTALRGLLAILLTVAGPWPAAAAQGSAAELLDARGQLARAFGPLVEAARHLDPRAFDVDALALDLVFEDAAGVVAEVHRRVRYQPYVGLLRGAQGTLAGGAGNALDQALLTATLLRTIGYEVEIRGATLDDAEVAALLAEVRPLDPSLAGPAGPELDVAANLRAGARETRTEGLVLTRAGAVVSPAFVALDVILAGARRDLAPGDVAAADALALPAAARAAIREDLERGYAVVAPATWDGRSESVGWWRVDPATGEALGRGADGRGNAFVEYLTSFEVSITITAGFAVYGAHQCSQIPDARTAGCCIVQNVALAAVGTAVGLGLGIAYQSARAALIIFGAMDVGYNVAGVYLPTFCPGG